MLNSIHITNFALMEQTEVEFFPGFNVVTGESGAGKSILMGAVALLAGGRVERGVIRSGADRCTVTGCFSIPQELRGAVSQLLEEAGVPWEESAELVLRRVIGSSATRNFINDTPVGTKLLSDIGSLLIDLHGANEQISLTVPARQLALLDRCGNLEELRKKCETLCKLRRDLAAERAEFDRKLPDAAEADRLALVVEEIEKVNPEPDEDERLASKQRLGANARQVLETVQSLTSRLTESESCVIDQLGGVFHDLAELARLDEAAAEPLLACCTELQDGVAALSGKIAELADRVELDPEELAAIEARMEAIFTLKRRYGPTLEQLFDTLEDARNCLAGYQAAAEKRAEFDRRDAELRIELQNAAAELSSRRRQEAEIFLEAAKKKLEAIGFSRCILEAEFTAVEPGPNGADRIELLFSANPGEPARPLRKVGSSGELSRIMLALKTVLADADLVPTVIFDEIDMNIGGETANRVGDELHALGAQRQILCISHLAQVASRADHHFRVCKSTEKERTSSHVELLKNPAGELARMLGGGASALQHARALLRSKEKTIEKGSTEK